MATKIVNISWCACLNEYQMDFLCDTDADFADLPKCATGSCAISVASGNVQMVNTVGDWVVFGG